MELICEYVDIHTNIDAYLCACPMLT